MSDRPKTDIAPHPGDHAVTGGMHDPAQWQLDDLNLAAYLDRVGLTEPLPPDLSTLRRLQRAHQAAIGFENVDVLMARSISLDLADLQAKLIARRRGGYCYEHNLLYSAVLQRLGYRPTRLLARVVAGGANPSLRPLSHMTMYVELEGRSWVTDVGFGAFAPHEPVPLTDGAQTDIDGWRFRLDRADDEHWVLSTRQGEGWAQQYWFTLHPQQHIDFQVANHYTSTHPSSPFTRQLIAFRALPGLRRSLIGSDLTDTAPDGTSTSRQLQPAQIPTVLAERFGIELSAEETAGLLDRLNS